MSIIIQPHIEERLRSNEMVWLTTVRPDGRPHSVPVWFLWDGATVLIENLCCPSDDILINLPAIGAGCTPAYQGS